MTAPTRMQEKIAGHLARLEQADLIRSGGSREMEFRFKHSLIQEATYAGLVRDQRRSLHREVANALLDLHPEIGEQQPAILARHYLQAGEDEPAFQFAVRAGSLARANHAYEEAVANFDIALQVIEALPVGPHADRIREAFVGRGMALEFGGRHAEAKQTYERLRDYAIKAGDPALEAEALNRLATSAVVGAEAIDLQELLDRALDRSRRAGDPLLLARALWNQGLLYRFSDPLRADSFFHQALDIVRTPTDPSLPEGTSALEIEGHILIDLMVSHLTSGRRRDGLRHGEAALAIFRRIDNPSMTADALTGLGLLGYFGGDFDHALSLADEAKRISIQIENPWGIAYSGWVSLSVLSDRAQWSSALHLAEEVMAASRRVPFLGFRANVHGILSQIHLELGQVDAAVKEADRMAAAFGEWTPANEPWKPWTQGVQARAYLAQGDFDRAATLVARYRELPPGVIPVFQDYYVLGPVISALDLENGDFDHGLAFAGQMIERLREESADRVEAEMLLWRGRLFMASGAPRLAADDLQRASDLLTRSKARALLWPVSAALSHALAAIGDRTRAADLRAEAARIVRAIAEEAGPSALQDSFLSRSEVAAVLA